jgi:DnaJ-class molecular chaperone
MVKDYYLILGVPIDAAPGAIRSAFRRLARQYHPDRGESANARSFQEVQEAYEVLSDPRRRARYDRARRPAVRHASPSRASAPDGEPEPLVAEPMPITGEPDAVRPSFEALVDRIWRNFTGVGVGKAERREPLDFELILNPEEALLGVAVPFEVPALSVCYHCGGSGRVLTFTCDACEGEGRIVERRSVEVNVPPGVRDGALIEVSLESLGVENLWLRVHVRIAPH